jgi:integrase
MIIKPYPKDNESRTFGVRSAWLEEVAEHIRVHGIGRDELLFSTKVGTPISRNTFRTRVWLPAVQASGIDFGVRVHDLRHVHASWLLAGEADLKGVMDVEENGNLGHAVQEAVLQSIHRQLRIRAIRLIYPAVRERKGPRDQGAVACSRARPSLISASRRAAVWVPQDRREASCAPSQRR